MRQKRAKSYRKQMLVYNHTFKFRAPYQVLVDNQVVEVAENSRIDLVKYIKNTVQEDVKILITQCAMQALYESKNQKAIDLAKLFERRRCGHKDKAIDPCDCIHGIVDINGNNKHRYVVVCQDIELRRKLRKVPGVPLLYMNRSVMVMEPLSSISGEKQHQYESAKLSQGLNSASAGIMKNQENDSVSVESKEAVNKKRKGPREPNPLSIKKKKTASNTVDNKSLEKLSGSRKRRHKSKVSASGNENALEAESSGNITESSAEVGSQSV